MYTYHPNWYPLEFCKRMNDTSLSCPLLVWMRREGTQTRGKKNEKKNWMSRYGLLVLPVFFVSGSRRRKLENDMKIIVNLFFNPLLNIKP